MILPRLTAPDKKVNHIPLCLISHKQRVPLSCVVGYITDRKFLSRSVSRGAFSVLRLLLLSSELLLLKTILGIITPWSQSRPQTAWLITSFISPPTSHLNTHFTKHQYKNAALNEVSEKCTTQHIYLTSLFTPC